MWELIALGLLSAVYPTLIAVAVAALSTPRPARTMTFFLLGGMIASVTIGCVIVFALHGSSVINASKSPVNPIVYFGVGAFALLLAFVIGRRPPTERKAEGGRITRTLNRSQSAFAAFGVGLVLNLVPGAWYIIALKDIAQANWGNTQIVLVIVLFCVLQYALIELPLLGFVFAPE